nr:hypothetical protein [Enterococcus massiliensis]
MALLTVGTIGLGRQAEAVGATPPTIVYEPDTYENITPTNGTNSNIFGQPKIDGGKVVQLTGADQLPKLNVTYTNDGSNDPWKGGKIGFHWESHVELTNYLDVINIPAQGFAFVAIINLPKYVLSADVLKAIDWDNAYLKINGANIKLDAGGLMSAGNHTLRFGMGSWDNGNIVGSIFNIITQPGFNARNIPIAFDITVDVAKMTASGDKYDTSPSKVLTKGKLQPSTTKLADFSVDFYDSNNVVQDRMFDSSIAPAGGRFYPKLTNDALNPAAYAKTSAFQLPTWNSYISPWDTTNKYNSFADTTEYVDGNNLNLPGTTNNRTLTMGLSEGSFAQQPTNRFNRVVNFFTGKNETTGATLTHTPTQTLGLNQQTSILYTGKDAGGTALSPVTLKVLEKYAVDGTVKPTNLEPDSQWGKLLTSAPYQVNAVWRASDLTAGSIHYRLYNKTTQKLVGTFEDKLFQTISTNNGGDNSANTTLPALASGQYYFDYKLIDDTLSKAYPNLAYKWQSEQTGISNLKAITVAGFPAISKESYLKNLSRTPETGKPLIALAGDIVQENSTFTLDKMGDSLADKKVSVALPENVIYEKGSLSLNGTVIPDDGIQNGISIPAQYLAKAGDKVTITYKYKINPITATTNAIDLPTKPAVLSGNIALSDGTKLPFTEVKTDTNLIQIPKQELALVDAPADFTFGSDLPLPTQTAYYKAKGDFSFAVRDTRLPSSDASWQITGKLSTPFKNTEGRELSQVNLYFNHEGKNILIPKDQSTPIYQNDGSKKGDIPVDFLPNDGLLLEVNSGTDAQVDKTYQGTITWELSTGPTE